MVWKRALPILLVIIILTLVLPFFAFLGQGRKTRIFVWVYRFPDKENQELVEELSAMGVGGVFLSVSPLKLDSKRDTFKIEYFQKMVDFLKLAQSQKIEVHAVVAEEPIYTFSDKHETVLDRVDAILSFNQQHAGSRFAGLQLDVEPYALEEWKDGTWEERELLFQQYIRLLAKVRENIENSKQPVVLSTTVAYWYGESISRGHLPSSSITELARYTDWFVPLVYDISSSQVSELVKKLEVYFVGSVIIGLRASDYKGYQVLADVMDYFSFELRSSKGLIGFSIFEFDQLWKMFRRSMSSASPPLSCIKPCGLLALTTMEKRDRVDPTYSPPCSVSQ